MADLSLADRMEIDTHEGVIQAQRYPNLPEVNEDESEWLYPMRRTMQEIIPGLYLGPYGAACRNKLNDMKAAGVTHVVCIRSIVEAHIIRPNHPDHFQYLVLDMDDSPLEMLIPKVRIATEFIDNCLNSNGKVLVHGNAGMSRSPALVVGYIISKFGVSFQKAIKYVQSKRFCICIKEVFAYQLKQYEVICKAIHDTPSVPGMSGKDYQTLKRTIDEILTDDDNNESRSSAAPRPRLDAISMELE